MDLYVKAIQTSEPYMSRVVDALSTRLVNFIGTVYITGIGKSAHVARKSVATWQSLGLSCQTILIQDLFHGDLGALRPGDMILYLSNSGNTDEIIPVARYIKNNFDIRQICLTANLNPKLGELAENFCITPGPITEADKNNQAPSVSSVLFMMATDLIGIRIAEKRGFTQEQFKKFHPGGDLGKEKAPDSHNGGFL
jgi:arabinose-5-phosphate isomerase